MIAGRRVRAAAVSTLAALLVLVAACRGSGEAGGAARSRARASLLLVTLDTTRADHLAPYGATGVATPALADLAARGVVFERAYSVAPLTLPAHATILTGLDPPHHGVRDNGVDRLDGRPPTLAGILAARGWSTAAFVSAAVLARRFGLARGFERYDDDVVGAASRQAGDYAERPAAATVGAALAWLAALPPERPFFLWVHIFSPHAPYAPPEPWATRFRDRPYDGEIAYADAEVARLLANPRIADRARTCVVVVGDHGEALGDHGEANHGILLYDATLRVPWIVRAPDGVPGARITTAVGLADVLPTVADLVGLDLGDLPAALDGTSRADAVRGRAAAAGRSALYAETLHPLDVYGWAPLTSLREGRYKYIDGPTPELYDTVADPEERHDLAGREPARMRTLAAALRTRTARARQVRAPASPASDAALRSLGYLPSRRVAVGGASRPDPKAMIELHQRFARSQELLRSGDLDAGGRQLETILERDPGNLAALETLAEVRAREGRLDAAEALAERAAERAPDDPSLHRLRAALALARNRFAVALAEIRRALVADPDDPELVAVEAEILSRAGRPKEAATLLAAQLAEHPESPALALAQARWVDLPGGAPQAAERRLRSVVAREPFRTAAWQALGAALEAQGRERDAVEVYRQGLERSPRDARLEGALGLVLARRGDAAEARPHLERAVALAPDGWPELHTALASLALARRDWEAAEREAERAIARAPAAAAAWNALGIARERLGRREQALTAYTRALSIAPSDTRPRLNRGLLLRDLGRFDAAAADFSRVVRDEPGNVQAHVQLGLLYAGPLHDPERARRHLQAALDLEPDPQRREQIRKLLGGGT